MGNKLQTKLIVLLALFSATSIFVYGFQAENVIEKKPSLSQYFDHINGYETLEHITLAEKVFAMLQVDDYTYVKYLGKQSQIYLYIGYYLSAEKAYMAHSPTVCYPSQGWQVMDKPKQMTMQIGLHKINYEEIITKFGKQKELVLYWYQAGLYTNTQVYKNKIDIGYNKLFKNNDEHGFVRVSVPFTDSDYVENKKVAIEFIRSFYPRFVTFIEPDANNSLRNG